MSTFEYLAIAYTLLFTSTALRLIGGIPYAFRRESRYWVHTGAVVLLLFGLVLNYWAFLVYRDVEWTLVRYIGVLGIPSALYFVAATLVPDDPRLIESWKNHYFERRVACFSGILAWGLLAALNATVVLEHTVTNPSRAMQLTIVAIGVSGLSSARAIVHRLLIGLSLVGVLMAGFILVQRGAAP